MYLNFNITYSGTGGNVNEHMHNFIIGQVSLLATPCIDISYSLIVNVINSLYPSLILDVLQLLKSIEVHGPDG